MNDLRRRITEETLLALFQPLIPVIKITPSLLDISLKVATVTFDESPGWLRHIQSHAPLKTTFGTLWKGVDVNSKSDEFIRAVKDGDLERAEMLAEFEDTDVNKTDDKGRTALHWACIKNLPEVAALCLSLARIDTSIEYEGRTAFDIACQLEKSIIPSLFYKSTFEKDKTDPQGALLQLINLTAEPDLDRTEFPGEALFDPAKDGNERLCAALFKKRKVNVLARNEDCNTALHIAAMNGHGSIARIFVNNGSDVNAVGKDHFTPLHYAAQRGDWETVKTLLDLKADKDAKDKDGKTALDWAMENGHRGTQGLLEDKGDKEDWEESGDESEESGTELHRAVKRRDRVAVKQLLRGGLNIEERNARGQTPLNVAAESGWEDIVQVLLDKGAMIEAGDLRNKTSLHGAARAGDLETLNLLLERNAYEDARDSNRRTPLHYAVAHPALVRRLLDGGATVGPKNKRNQTPLYAAAAIGSAQSVRILLERGASPRVRDSSGKTASDIALENGHNNIVEMLSQNA